MNDIEVCILAGGFGTRLKSVVSDRPKVLAEISGKPIIAYIFDQLISDGFEKVNLLIGYKAFEIRKYFGNKYKKLFISYSEEDKPLGTGGAIKYFSKSCKSNRLLIINGDTIVDISRLEFLKNISEDFDAILAVKNNNISRYGKLDYDEDSNLIQILEKTNLKEEGIINSGTYLLDVNEILKFPKNIFSLEKDYFPLRIKQRKIKVIISDSSFLDIGIPEDYEKAKIFLEKCQTIK